MASSSEKWSEINDAAEEAQAAAEASAESLENEMAVALIDIQSQLAKLTVSIGNAASIVENTPHTPEKIALLAQFLNVSTPAMDELESLNSKFIQVHDSQAREEHVRAEAQQKLAEEALAKAKKQVEEARSKYRPIKGKDKYPAASYAGRVGTGSVAPVRQSQPRAIAPLKVTIESINGEKFSCAIVGCKTVSDRKIPESVKLAIEATQASNIKQWGTVEDYVDAVNSEFTKLPLKESIYRNLGIEMCHTHLKAVRGNVTSTR